MECPKCGQTYEEETRNPLLLIKCGHSICHSCAVTLFRDKGVICPECKKETPAESVTHLPKNMALLALAGRKISQTPHIVEGEMCAIHGRKLEGFCQDDKALLCINCIMKTQHKTHQIIPLEQATLNELQRMKLSVENSKIVEEKLLKSIQDMNESKNIVKDLTKNRIECATTIYDELVLSIRKQESSLKQSISDLSKKKEEILEFRIIQAKEQLEQIKLLQKEYQLALKESHCELLSKGKAREEIEQKANIPIPEFVFNSDIPPILREEEFTKVKNSIIVSPPKIPPSGKCNMRNSGELPIENKEILQLTAPYKKKEQFELPNFQTPKSKQIEKVRPTHPKTTIQTGDFYQFSKVEGL